MKYKRLPASEDIEDRRDGDQTRQKAIRDIRAEALEDQAYWANGVAPPRIPGSDHVDLSPPMANDLRDALGREAQENVIHFNKNVHGHGGDRRFARGGRVAGPRRAKTKLRYM